MTRIVNHGSDRRGFKKKKGTRQVPIETVITHTHKKKEIVQPKR